MRDNRNNDKEPLDTLTTKPTFALQYLQLIPANIASCSRLFWRESRPAFTKQGTCGPGVTDLLLHIAAFRQL